LMACIFLRAFFIASFMGHNKKAPVRGLKPGQKNNYLLPSGFTAFSLPVCFLSPVSEGLASS
jgi:hypothetical protein